MRIYALADADVLPKSVVEGLDGLPNFKAWASSIRQEKSVLSIWDGHKFVDRTRTRLERMKAPQNPAPKAG
jgi:glutathione S-transferase